MINVLHTIDTTGPGGAETVFLQLLRRLDREMYNPVVLIRGKGYVYDQLLEMGIKPHIVDAKGSFNIGYLLNLVKIIRKYKIKLVQSHLFGSNVYCSIAGLLTSVAVISVFHGLVDFNNESYRSLKFWLINAGSKKIVFVSEFLKELTLQSFKFNESKITTIYNGVDIEKYTSESNEHEYEFIDKDKFNIICVGNIRRPKGYDVLISAAADIKSQPINFIIIGDKDPVIYHELTELADNLGVRSLFNFIGFRHDVADILKHVDLFVLPSTSEGFSISTIEAMACGIPVIATKSGGPQEIIHDQIDGILVATNSPQELALAIDSLYMNKPLREKYVSNAKNTVSQKFSLDVSIAQYQDLYQSLSD